MREKNCKTFYQFIHKSGYSYRKVMFGNILNWKHLYSRRPDRLRWQQVLQPPLVPERHHVHVPGRPCRRPAQKTPSNRDVILPDQGPVSLWGREQRTTLRQTRGLWWKVSHTQFFSSVSWQPKKASHPITAALCIHSSLSSSTNGLLFSLLRDEWNVLSAHLLPFPVK